MKDDSAEDDRAAIRARTSELLAAVNASDVSGILAVWCDDGVMLPPHHAPVRGAEAIGAYFHRLFAMSSLTFKFTSSELHIAGDSAFELVTYTATVTSSRGSQADDIGKGLHIYCRHADRSWKLKADIWNSDL